MGISLKSIADDLSLSKATVSWILSGKGEEKGFSAATIKQVTDYARKVGYTPNLIARSLSMGYTKTIGLIIPSISDTFYSQMAQSVEASVSSYGYVLILGSSEGDETKEQQLIRSLRSQQVAGLIIAPTNKSDKAISMMLHDNFPFVLIDRYIPELRSNYVIVDNENSSYSLVRHLYSSGCRRVAVITTDMHLYVMGKRISGYRKAVLDSGLPLEDRLCVEIDRNTYIEDVKDKMNRLLDEVPDVDGFFFTTHYLAEEVMRYFIMHGTDYRHKFRFACIHSTRALDILSPEMARAMMPITDMGRKSVDILIENISSRDDFDQKELILDNTLLMEGI